MRRLKGRSPQTDNQALWAEIQRLSSEVRTLRQVGPSTVQTDDIDFSPDPIQGQIVINHPGSHVDADADTGVAYYHDGAWRNIAAPALAGATMSRIIVEGSVSLPNGYNSGTWTSLTLVREVDPNAAFAMNTAPTTTPILVSKSGLYSVRVRFLWPETNGRVLIIGGLVNTGADWEPHPPSPRWWFDTTDHIGGVTPQFCANAEWLLEKKTDATTGHPVLQVYHNDGVTRNVSGCYMAILRLQ